MSQIHSRRYNTQDDEPITANSDGAGDIKSMQELPPMREHAHKRNAKTHKSQNLQSTLKDL